jgi:soluble lytic murein transglycosylase-like protein
VLAFFAALPVSGAARADDSSGVYRIDDIPGEVHLSDSAAAPPGVVVTRILEAPSNDAVRPRHAIEPRGLASIDAGVARMIDAAAAAQRLDPHLLRALIAVESAFRPDAVSRRGAAGLTQLMPETARDYGVTDIFDPHQNIEAGARHLRWLLDRYGQDTERALAAYNAGSGAIERSRSARSGSWPSAETTRYVERVLARYGALRRR